MGIPDHLTCLLRNLCAGHKATIRTGHETTDWLQLGKGVHQGCILSSCLFNLYSELLWLFSQSCLTFCDPMDCSTLASLSFTISQTVIKPMSIESVMSSNHFVLCRPLVFLPSVFPRIRLFTSGGSQKRQENSRKTFISASLTTLKPLTVWITTNCGKFLKEWEYQITLPVS